MKNFLFLLLFLPLCSCADVDRAVSFEELPLRAQTFLREHFPATRIACAKREWEFLEVKYEVVLVSGLKVKFRRSGVCKKISCRYGSVPAELIPAAIAEKIAVFAPNAVVTELERKRHKIGVQLNNRQELTFDRNYELIDVEDWIRGRN